MELTENPGTMVELINNDFSYNVEEKITQTKGKKLSDLITKGTGKTYLEQWISSRTDYCMSNLVSFGVRKLSDKGRVIYSTMYYSIGPSLLAEQGENKKANRVRPVVTLEANIQLTGSSESGWTIE